MDNIKTQNEEQKNTVDDDYEKDLATGKEKSKEDSEERTFTKDEVTAIVQRRLAKLKHQNTKDDTSDNSQPNELDKKMQDLKQREMSISVKEALIKNNMPVELADVIKCDDINTLEDKLNVLKKYVEEAPKQQKGGFYNMETNESLKPGQKIGSSHQQSTRDNHTNVDDPYRKAMGLK